MSEMRKITVEVPEELLADAQAYTGEGISETVRAGLRRLAVVQAQQDARKLRGRIRFSLSLDQLRHDPE
jgi:Arc/MetJ-type ribon-helix-helix transcriptional regulator